MTVYQSLLTTVGKLPVLDAENDEDYLKRLVLCVSSTPIEVFDRMDDGARQWFNNAADALSEGTRVPVPDGFDRSMSALPPPVRTIARPTGAIVHIPEPPPAPRPQPPDTEPRPGKEPIRDSIIKLVIANPDLSVDGLVRKLKEYRIHASVDAVSTQRGFAVSMLRLIREAGWRPPPATA